MSDRSNPTARTDAPTGREMHTPGPWAYWPSYTGEEDTFEVGPDQFETVAHVRLGCDDVGGSCEANARLIAAAPDLYTALVDMRKRFHATLIASGTDPEFADIACARADAALALARQEPTS